MVPGTTGSRPQARVRGIQMATRRHRKTNSSKFEHSPHVQKLRELSRAGIQVDPTSSRAVSRAYRKFQRTKEMARPVSKKQAAEFKEHGFYVSGKNVIIDGPRDKRRKQIKGARVTPLSGGVVKTSTKQRRDFVYGFTKKEKKEFAKNPELVTKQILAQLRKRFPSLRKARKIQERLQWGSYQATKDFAPSYFTARYFSTTSPEEIRRKGKRRAAPRVDKLTGLHFVIHVPSNARKRKRGKNGKKKQ